MASLTIRQIDDAVYERLKQQAKANHRSVEAEARARIEGRPAMSRAVMVARLRSVRIDPGPDYQGSVAAIREARDGE